MCGLTALTLQTGYLIGVCGMYFFYFGSVFKKPLIWFGISLVWFGLKNAVWLDITVIYYSCNSNYYSDNG